MGAVPALTETTWRGLARSSPWRWRALSFDLHRRPLHGPNHTVRAVVVRPDRVVVVGPDGRVDETDYAFVAMLDPVELADASPPLEHPVVRRVARPPAVEVHRLDADLRGGRETWWAEVSPRVGYDPRCSCCPLLWGRASEDLEAVSGGATMPSPPVSGAHPERHLVGLDLETGVCVHVEHLDGDFAGRGFSLDVLGVDDEVVLPTR